MSTEELFSLSGIVLLLSAPLGLWNSRNAEPVLRVLTLAGAVLLAAGFGVRWHEYAAGMQIHWLLAFPVSTFYESAAFLVLSFIVVSLVYLRRFGSRFLAFANLLGATAVLALNFSSIPAEPVLFLPSLKSYWLVAHVTLSFVAYAMYAVAAAAGLRVLLTKSDATGRRAELAGLMRKLAFDATLVFTIGGLVFGAIWAQHSWGRFWAWDPKETWALITWCAYVVMLHADWRRPLCAEKLALWCVANFCIVLFAYLGVSVLFAGLHSYISLPEVP